MNGEREGDEENNGLVSRRWLLKVAASAAVIQGLPSKLLAAPGYEGTLLTPEDLAYFEELLRNPDTLRNFQTSPTSDQVASVVRTLARTDTTWTRSIEEDRYTLHAGARTLSDSEGNFVGNATVLRIRDLRVQSEAPAYRYILVTARHVAKMSPAPRGRAWTAHPIGYDVSVCEISAAEASHAGHTKADALHLGTLPAKVREDISGKVCIVLGRDNDSGILKKKVYPSLVSPPLSQEVLRVMRVATSASTQANAFRMIVLPPLESRSSSNGSVPAQGMSGSGLLYVSQGARGVEYGGLIASVVEVMVGSATYSLAFIIDHTHVREAIDTLLAKG